MTFPSTRLRFEEALAWFQQRLNLTDEELAIIQERAEEQAFFAAGGTMLMLVQAILDATDQAEQRGDDFADFLGTIAVIAIGIGVLGRFTSRGDRLETIWVNQIQKGHNLGRIAEHTKPGRRRLRPFWMYDAVMDTRTSNVCRQRNGIVREADDPFWQSNYPPLHHRCRSMVRTLTKRQGAARRVSTADRVIDQPPGKGFGDRPSPERTDGEDHFVDNPAIDPENAAAWARDREAWQKKKRDAGGL